MWQQTTTPSTRRNKLWPSAISNTAQMSIDTTLTTLSIEPALPSTNL